MSLLNDVVGIAGAKLMLRGGKWYSAIDIYLEVTTICPLMVSDQEDRSYLACEDPEALKILAQTLVRRGFGMFQLVKKHPSIIQSGKLIYFPVHHSSILK